VALKTLIVDDEPIARRVLREDLQAIHDVRIVGEAESGPDALIQMERLKPDLVLLDLQMPGMGGLEVIRHLRHAARVPVFIIVTAHDSYAIEAFEAGAVHYLLKPVRQERLAAAVDRACRVTGIQAAEKLAYLQGILPDTGRRAERRIVGRHQQEYFLLPPHEVLALQAEGEIVWIVTARRRYTATLTLKALEELLVTSGFRRIHRNTLVNLDHVRKMSALTSQRWLVTLSNNEEVIASKRLVRSIRELLHPNAPAHGEL